MQTSYMNNTNVATIILAGGIYMEILDKLFSKEKEIFALGLILTKEFPSYFCTPLDFLVLGHLGTDGVHYCINISEK